MWVTVQSFLLPQDAYMAKSFLESEGVSVFLKDELTAQVNNFYCNAMDGVKLQVPREEELKAVQLLQKGGFLEIRSDDEVTDVPYFNGIRTNECPFCGSDNVEVSRQANGVLSWILRVLGTLFPGFRSHQHCFDCNRNWRIRR